MAKKVKKRVRSGQKDKRMISTSSPKDAPHDVITGDKVIDNGTPVLVEGKKVCVHIEKGVDVAKLSSKIESTECTGCEDCRVGSSDRRAGKGKGKSGKKGASDSKAKPTWVCLQCGHFACGGVGLPSDPQCHAIRHSRTNRHPLVIQLENPRLRWCFPCSLQIPAEDTTGEHKDVFSDIVKLFKKPSPNGTSEDVESIWFGSESISELKTENKEGDVVNGKDFYGVRGLVNLGNTCFFNSVLQNVLAIDILREYLLKNEGSMGPLTSSLKKIFVETSSKTGLRTTINPRSLFGCVCTKAPQFRGYQQQDSHELLRYLLDGLSSEETFANKYDNSTSENNGGIVSARSTFVDALFGGRLSSTVCCVECGHSSVVYEPFLDLSLPVPTKKPPQKKSQTAFQSKKMKLPPKRGAKFIPKLNKNVDSVPNVSGCSPSIGSETSSVIKEASIGCSSSADLGESSNVIDVNGPASHYSNDATEQEATSAQESPSVVQGADSMACSDYVDSVTHSVPQNCDNMTWFDYLDTIPPLEDLNFAADYVDPPVSLGSGSKNDDLSTVQDSSKSIGEAIQHDNNLNSNSECTVSELGGEHPIQVPGNQILLLTYKEDSAAVGEESNLNAENSPSAMPGGEDSLGFDGLADMFNEPEVDVSTSSAPYNFPANGHNGNGSVAANISESDPDEVDNTNSPVSVESCLAHFIKPELLSGEHAWHCENCSKLLLKRKQNMRKHQLETASVVQRNASDGCSSSEVMHVRDPPVCSASNVLAAGSNGSYDPDECCQKLDAVQINGHYPNSTQGRNKIFMPENPCSISLMMNEREDVPSSSACVGPSHEASLGSSSVDVPNHVSAKRLSRQDKEHESSDEEDGCKSVKVMRDATKRILVEKVPPILTIHLKRFGQDARGRVSKLNGYVGFKEYLDLGPYLDSRSPEKEKGGHVYRLVGVVEHSGSMRGGHYIAYVRGGDSRKEGAGSQDGNRQRNAVWYYTSDAHVRETTLEEVLRSEAYLLFYEKR